MDYARKVKNYIATLLLFKKPYLSVAAAVSVLTVLSIFNDKRPDKTIPIPHFNLPIVGHLPYLIYQTLRKRIMYEMLSDAKKYGTYWANIPPVPGMQLMISDPPSVQVLLEDLQTFVMPPLRHYLFSRIFGNGIFLSDGEEWSYQRNLAKPIFNLHSRTSMFDVYHQCCENLLTVLDHHHTNHQPIELQQLFKRFTLDTFGIIGFGYSFNSLLKPIPFSETFDWLLAEVDLRVKFPWRRVFLSWLWEKKLKEMEDFLANLVEERKKEGWEGKSDFLSKLLEMEQDKEIEMKQVTPKFLRDQIMNFFVAGRDTTAILLSSTFYFLSLHPEVDAKVRKEIEQIVGKEKVSMKHTKDLKYLQCVLNESLRLFPPAVPYNSRTTTRPVTLPNGARVPKGVSVMYSPFVVHRLEQYWGADAELFIPERWEKENVLKHPYQYVPFQKGPRLCLGMNMAQEEAKCCIAILYQNGFKLDLVSKNEQLTFHASAILWAEKGIVVNVEKVRE